MSGCLSARFSAVASMGLAANLRARLLKKIQSFSFSNTDRFTPASLVMRCTSDVNSMQTTFQELIRNMVRAPMMMIFAIIMSFSIDPQLAWIFVVCLPMLFVTIALIVSTGPIQMLTMWICTVVILYVGGSNIIFGRTSLQAGELISIVTYTGRSSTPCPWCPSWC